VVTRDPVLLPDGSVVVIRPIRPEDAALLAEGFARMSSQSRQLRFLSGKPNLTPAELRYFTHVDHHDHEALGAMNPVDGRGLGIARFIRHTDDFRRAEIAVTVVDDWQRRGLATALFHQLADRGRQEGIRRFTALVAADNAAVAGILQNGRLGVRVTHRDSDTVEYEITLPPRGLGEGLQALLRALGRLRPRAPVSIHGTLAGPITEDPGHSQ